jgi:hypothetical protein
MRNEYAEKQKMPLLKPEDFIFKFGHMFADGRQGATTTSSLIDIGRELGLCGFASTSVDFEKVKKIYSEKRATGIFISSEWNEENSIYSEKKHWQIMAGILPNGDWRVWHPNLDGVDFHTDYTDDQMKIRKVHFVIFYPPTEKDPE